MKHRVDLIKADIDRFCTNPDFKDRFSFPKGKGTLSYLVKLFILFFVGKTHCFRAIFYKRIGRVSYLIKWLFPVKYNTLSIICKDIEGGIYFAHPYGTVLNCEHIGYGCSFMQNTTFGNKPKNGKLVRPYLESYVQVGANAVVVGDVHIGNYVKIGAGAVVTKSIPDNCVVVGNPARIIFKNGKRVNIPL